jgi:eukaryotic-like serine/threonine-protein kinase
LWSNFESDVVEGQYRLGKLVRSEGRCGWFETQLLNEKPALISLTESLNDETTLLDRLRAAAKVRHVNVAAILQAGATSLQSTPLVYAVMEHTEENLEDVLRARALSADETRQVAESLIQALEAIHRERLVCGRLEAASVLAAGDTIKLRSDHLQIVPKDAALDEAAAKDVQGLGAVLYQCLTQRRPKLDGNDPSVQLLPPPFVQAVRRALSGQATLAEIAGLLRPASVAPSVSPAVPAPDPVSKAAPKVVEMPELVDDEPNTEEHSHAILWWIAGTVAAILVITVLAVHGLRHSPAPAAESSTAAPAPAPAPKPAAAPAPSAAATAPAATPHPAALPKQDQVSSGAWRVVAFTYNHQDQAEHKAQTIGSKHPELQPAVFSPKGSGAPYLVTLGGPMDRTSAFQLRGKAIQKGLPRDTYAQNYSH